MLRNNDETAFPIQSAEHPDNSQGMSLRDFFAAKALGGLAADPRFGQESVEYYAILAYKLSDAMMEVRKTFG